MPVSLCIDSILYNQAIICNLIDKKIMTYFKPTFLFVLILSCQALHSQSYSKGDLLLSMNAGIVNFRNGENDITWKGMPVATSLEYMLLNKNDLTFGVGFNATYFRHHLNNINYGVLGIGIPISLHYNLLPRATVYAGFLPGLYFDGYEPVADAEYSGYGGLYSEMFAGVRYFVVKRLALYAQISTGDFRIDAGVTYKF